MIVKTDVTGLYKDLESKAVIVDNAVARERFRADNEFKKRVHQLESQVSDIITDINEIKNMLMVLIKR